ncbi:MAG: bifunctional nuclease family protein [Bacteroidetes bacterium]|nr:bifunctional nuclease family protein [Bacteroidota bacterium]
MDKIELEIAGLASGHTSKNTSYTLILGEVNGERRIPVVIGAFEAQAIALVLENIRPQRPLTHDLFKSLADDFHIDVIEVNICNLVEGVFYSKIKCIREDDEVEIDARTSDAIALAVRFDCPIYTNAEIITAAGITQDNEEGTVDTPGRPDEIDDFMQEISENTDYSGLELDDLEILLTEALQEEDYAKAASIRDEMNRRK